MMAFLTALGSQCDLKRVEDRFDCHPEKGATEGSCLDRGCCWNMSGTVAGANANVPVCFYPKYYTGYGVDSIDLHNSGAHIALTRNTPSGIDDDVQTVDVDVTYYDQDIARITIGDATRLRYVPPLPEIPNKRFAGRTGYKLKVTTSGVLRIHRLGEHNKTLFHVDLSRLVFTEYFLQLSTWMPTNVVYGLGEQWTSLRRSVNWTRYLMFTRDGAPRADVNLYGAHPFYVAVEKGGSAHGVFLHNSNFIEVLLQPTPAATFRALGGVLDFFLFTGPTPGDVVQQYQRVVGFPAMPPYWGLGFHLCRYGYGSLNRTRQVMENNIRAGIPLDVQWNDIDYMDKWNDFTYDKVKYAGLPEFVADVHEGGRHYVMMFDPGVSGSERPGTYPPFDDGLKMNVFVKNVTGGIVYAKVWNKVSTVFPDFTHPNATDFWKKQFQRFHATVPFDGAWIDMNEPSTYYNGHKEGCPSNQRVEHPPYVPGKDPLSIHTLCMSDQHYISPHYNVHSVYPQLEAKATYQALVEIHQKRPFIISRSTSAGQGAWSGHWSGDILSSWEDLRLSIPNILSFGLYGIPLAGADICGFRENTTAELCARWQVVGAFYPFSRNHNDLRNKDQDPYSMGAEVVDAAKSALKVRYALLPYLYTLFYRSHVYGETVARALSFEFPEDPKTHDIDEQFMWGSALLFSPALYEAQRQVTAYVPKGMWYDFYKGRQYRQAAGDYRTFPAPLNQAGILVRGGHIVPMQEPALTTTESRKNNISLLVAPDARGKAEGMLYWDDGESLGAVQKNMYSLFEFTLAKDLLVINNVKKGNPDKLILGDVIIFGVSEQPTSVSIAGGHSLTFTYMRRHEVLAISSVGEILNEDFSITWA
ncbi:hypothetical protein V5799_030885 [Amblyomma americanum]|uniref:P-type domain-containing protein n=1 Tax=Amblyomma americanum TaxID=6943 RepID=A0AAQ4EMC1_AMBAM